MKQLEEGCTNVGTGQGTGGSEHAGVTVDCPTGGRGLCRCC